jgi:hypothetical protein
MSDPERAVGKGAFRALQQIAERLDLDYAGIDFSIIGDQVLVFEANPTMLAHYEKLGSLHSDKNEYVARIQTAFEQMLVRREDDARRHSRTGAIRDYA